jgi:polyketide cyclase/dehydrase/lipid transport protein
VSGRRPRAFDLLPSGAVENTVELHAPSDVVFDYMTDIRNEPCWNPQMVEAEKLTPGEIGAGTRFRARLRRGVGETIIRHVRFDRPSSWASRSSSRLLDVDAENEVVAAPEGCRLTIRTRLHPRGVMRLATPLLGWWMRRTWDRDLHAVKTLLESPERGARVDGATP